MKSCQEFFDCYQEAVGDRRPIKVIDIGAQDVNGSLRQICPSSFDYVGVDFVAGKGVDVVLDDPYRIPFPNDSVDIVLSSSCFEHAEMFWVLFLEVLRVLKPNGLFYLNAPSNGDFHRWPVDCWRFYPDAGRALVTWAKRNAMQPALLESYTGIQIGDQWNDFVAVFIKEEAFVKQYPKRMLDAKRDYNNGLVYGSFEFSNQSVKPEDKRNIHALVELVAKAH